MSAKLQKKLTRAGYDRIKALNFSKLKHMGRSPAHYQHEIHAEPPSDTPARKMGRCHHMAVLEPQEFKARVAVWAGGRRAGATWEAFREHHSEHEIITMDEHAQCVALAASVYADETSRELLHGGSAEVTVRWASDTGRPCKGRVDYLGSAGIVDLKTTRDASPSAFSRDSWSRQYHVQAAWYVDGVRAATGIEHPYWVLAVESAAPYVVQVYRMPAELLEYGRAEYRRWLALLDTCEATGQWGGYAGGVADLALPPWLAREAEDGAGNIEDLDLDTEGLTQ